jgi:hypothetical protein
MRLSIIQLFTLYFSPFSPSLGVGRGEVCSLYKVFVEIANGFDAFIEIK